MMCPMTRHVTATVALLLAFALAGCATTAKAPVDQYEAAHTICWITQDKITEHHQPDAAAAWHKTNDKLCTAMAEKLGKEDFISFWLDKDNVAKYIEEQW